MLENSVTVYNVANLDTSRHKDKRCLSVESNSAKQMAVSSVDAIAQFVQHF